MHLTPARCRSRIEPDGPSNEHNIGCQLPAPILPTPNGHHFFKKSSKSVENTASDYRHLTDFLLDFGSMFGIMKDAHGAVLKDCRVFIPGFLSESQFVAKEYNL